MLPAPVSEVADGFRALAGDSVTGVFVIGSAALGDWQAGASDVDLVAVGRSDRAPDREALRDLHARHRAASPEPAPSLEVLHLRAGDLGAPPGTLGPRPHLRDGLLRDDDAMVTPVTWHSIAEHGVPVGAADAVAGDVHLDVDALRAWCRDNLDGYWTGWATRGANPATRDGMALLTDWGVAWCVLGVLRLRYTLATGEITSKSGAGRWGLATAAGADRSLIEDALALRSIPAPEPPADAPAARDRRDAVVSFLRRTIAAR